MIINVMVAFISSFGPSFLANFLLLLFPFFLGDMLGTLCLLQAAVSILKNLLEINLINQIMRATVSIPGQTEMKTNVSGLQKNVDCYQLMDRNKNLNLNTVFNLVNCFYFHTLIQ